MIDPNSRDMVAGLGNKRVTVTPRLVIDFGDVDDRWSWCWRVECQEQFDGTRKTIPRPWRMELF